MDRPSSRCRLFLALSLALFGTSAAAQTKILMADGRPRPPELVVDEQNNTCSGPLVEVLDEAVKSLGYAVHWRPMPFPRTLEQLKKGKTDLVPRLVMTEDRKHFAEFLGPIGIQPTDIAFLVKPGKEHTLKSYADLKHLKIGVKHGTAYFERFDKDSSIARVESLDDENLSQMFDAGRFDAMIVLDKAALDKTLNEKKIAHAWADYEYHVKLGIYYGMSKASKHAALAKPLSDALVKMAQSGRVAEIYKKYKVPPLPTK